MEAYIDEKNYISKINLVLEQNGIFTNYIDAEEDLALDSLTQISLLVCFENEFEFEFPDDKLIDIPQTYNGLVMLVLENIDCNKISTEIFEEGGQINEKKA